MREIRKNTRGRDLVRQVFKEHERSRAGEVGIPEGALHVGSCPETGEPIYLDAGDLNKHLHVMGGWGTGKSYFLRRLVHQLVWRKKRTGEGFSIIDPHGTLARYARDVIAADAPEFAQETIYLDLTQAEKVVPFDPLRRQGDAYHIASCLAEGVMKACGDLANVGEKPLLARTFIKLAQGLKLTAGSLTDYHFLLYGTPQDKKILADFVQKLPPGTPVRSFWQELKTKRPDQREFYTVGVLNRLERFLEPSPLRRMLAPTETSIDISAIMNNGGIALFDLSRARTAVSRDAQLMLAALLVQEFYQELDRRDGDESALPHTILLDEFGDYATPDFGRALTSGRKFNVRCVFAHQNLSQLVWDEDRTLLETVLSVPNKAIFGRVPVGEAKMLAEDIFFALLNPLEVKYWHEEIHWDPVSQLVTTRSRAHSRSEGADESVGDTTSATESARAGTESSGQVVDPESGRTIETSSTAKPLGPDTSSGRASTHMRTFRSAEAWVEGYNQQWATFYKKRVEQRPEFKSLEEQIHDYARLLKLQPQRRCIVSRIDQLPRQCRVVDIEDLDLTAEDRQHFNQEMYSQVPRVFLDPEEAEQLIEVRRKQLLGSGDDVENEVID